MVRHRDEVDARRATDRTLPGTTPIFLGEWRESERISSLVGRDRAGAALWTGILQEGEREPWIVPCFGLLLIVSSENALLIGENGRVVEHDQAGWRFVDVLFGRTVVWVVGDIEARRITASGSRGRSSGTRSARCLPVAGKSRSWDRILLCRSLPLLRPARTRRSPSSTSSGFRRRGRSGISGWN